MEQKKYKGCCGLTADAAALAKGADDAALAEAAVNAANEVSICDCSGCIRGVLVVWQLMHRPESLD